jgi:hypothetical protein
MRSYWLGLMLATCRPPDEPPVAPYPPPPGPATTPAAPSLPQPAAPATPAKASVQPMSPEVKASRNGENFRLELGALALEVDAKDGGRIIEFSLDGQNALVTRAESGAAYGSSFWPSPQSEWNWPPPVELDRDAWQAAFTPQGLELSSATNAALGLSASQRIRLEAAPPSAVIDYTLHNHGAAARRVAPWQNSRVRPGGLTFYPSGAATLPHSALKLAPKDGVTFFAHDPASMKLNRKSFADGREGFLAHVDRELLFVKVFPDVPANGAAPGEAEIEIYVDGAGKFVEVEQQGAFVEIPPGGTSSWSVRWLLERVPKDIVAPGNATLVERARQLAASAAPK